MTASTNSLVVKAKKFALPVGGAATLLLAATFFLGHNAVHAASAPSPLDDHSVAALTALDDAVESVAARVTPAVVRRHRLPGGQSHRRRHSGGRAP